MKTCTVCNIEKPYEDFHKLKSAKDGRQFRCKVCKNAYTRNKYKREAANPKVTPTHSTCVRCDTQKPVKDFRVKQNGVPYSYCKPCSKDYTNKVRSVGKVIFESKKCTTCLEVKPFADYERKNNRYSNSSCKSCLAKKNRMEYRANPQIALSTKESTRRRKDKNESFIFDYLLSNPCVDCGEDNPAYLEFDHKDQSTKDDCVSRYVDKVGLQRLVGEVEKCDVRCRKCHRRKTAKQMGWYKNLVPDFDYESVVASLEIPENLLN